MYTRKATLEFIVGVLCLEIVTTGPPVFTAVGRKMKLFEARKK